MPELTPVPESKRSIRVKYSAIAYFRKLIPGLLLLIFACILLPGTLLPENSQNQIGPLPGAATTLTREVEVHKQMNLDLQIINAGENFLISNKQTTTRFNIHSKQKILKKNQAEILQLQVQMLPSDFFSKNTSINNKKEITREETTVHLFHNSPIFIYSRQIEPVLQRGAVPDIPEMDGILENTIQPTSLSYLQAMPDYQNFKRKSGSAGPNFEALLETIPGIGAPESKIKFKFKKVQSTYQDQIACGNASTCDRFQLQFELLMILNQSKELIIAGTGSVQLSAQAAFPVQVQFKGRGSEKTDLGFFERKIAIQLDALVQYKSAE